MNIREVVLEVDEIGRGRLLVDGLAVPQVRAVQIEAKAQEVTQVRVTLAPVRVRFAGKAEVAFKQEELPADEERGE